MAYNNFSANELRIDHPFSDAAPGNLPAESGASPLSGPYGTHRPGWTDPNTLNTAVYGYRPEAHSALYPGQSTQTASHPLIPVEMTSAFSGDHSQPMQNNLQHQLGQGPVSPQIATTYLPQTPTNQPESNLVKPPTSRGQLSASQKPSVKHLTCW